MVTRRVRRERCGSGITTHCASNRTLPRSSSCGEAAVETSVDMPEERNSEALTEKKDGTSYDGSVINPHNHFSPSRTWPLSVSNNCASVCDGRISSTAWFSNCKSDPSSPHRDLLQPPGSPGQLYCRHDSPPRPSSFRRGPASRQRRPMKTQSIPFSQCRFA